MNITNNSNTSTSPIDHPYPLPPTPSTPQYTPTSTSTPSLHLQFGIFTEGLDSMLGDKDAPSSDVESSAGMSLDILGVALRPLRFFTGNTEMISALWNAPADLTSALQVPVAPPQ